MGSDTTAKHRTFQKENSGPKRTFPKRISLLESLQVVWQVTDEDSSTFFKVKTHQCWIQTVLKRKKKKEEEEEKEGTTGGVLRARLLLSKESTDSMVNRKNHWKMNDPYQVKLKIMPAVI